MKSTFCVVNAYYWKKNIIQIANNRENKKDYEHLFNLKLFCLNLLFNISILKVSCLVRAVTSPLALI